MAKTISEKHILRIEIDDLSDYQKDFNSLMGGMHYIDRRIDLLKDL